jgi:hypothetical protein
MDTKIKKEQMVKVFLLEEIKRLTKVDDKLEQRIAKLEKVLASHAKCIGQLREDNNGN